MRLVIQRVSSASVEVDNQIVGKIGKGLLVFLGIHKTDTIAQIPWLVNKLLNLRIFEDDKNKMNLSVKEVVSEVLVVSQFTLYGNCSKGRRPDFLEAAPGEIAEPLYLEFTKEISRDLGRVQKGVFGAFMNVSLVNDGPVTMILDG